MTLEHVVRMMMFLSNLQMQALLRVMDILFITYALCHRLVKLLMEYLAMTLLLLQLKKELSLSRMSMTKHQPSIIVNTEL